MSRHFFAAGPKAAVLCYGMISYSFLEQSASRRAFLRSAAGAAMALRLGAASDPWGRVPAILGRIKPPLFPNRQFDITRYGARGDGTTDSTEGIARAIAECSRAGGGRVVAPAGDFLTGAIHLRSNVNLHISAGATLRFSQDPRRYLPVVFTRWEGVECMNYSPFVYAYGQRNVAVTGPGTLDGQAGSQHWWPWSGNTRFGWKAGDPAQPKARASLAGMGEKDVPAGKRIFGEGSYLRPNFLQFYRCRNVLIEDITLHNSPMWQVHPVLSTNVIVRRVKPASLGPNNDGCNPESCRDVLIEDCQFDTGDDCIAIKSGRNRDGRRVARPSENIVIRGCQMKDGHGGVTIGSEASGGVRNVFAEDCRMDSPNLDRALRLKTNSVRGGFIEHIYMRNVTVGQVADAILHIDLFYEEGDKGSYPPVVRDIEMRNVTSRKSVYALYLRGYKSDPIRDVRLIDCTFDNVAKPDVIESVEGLDLASVTVNGRRRGPA
jgi:polygalacturonase